MYEYFMSSQRNSISNLQRHNLQLFSRLFEKISQYNNLIPVFDPNILSILNVNLCSLVVKSSHLYLYSALNNTNCVKATAHYQNRKIVYQ